MASAPPSGDGLVPPPPPTPETRVGFTPHRGWTVGAWIVAGAAAGVVAWIWASLAIHAGQPVYRVTGLHVALGVVAGVAALAGAALMVRSGRHDVAVLATAGGILVFLGAVAILSIGIFILLLAAWPIVSMARRLRFEGGHARAAVLAGPLIGAGLVAMLFAVPRAAITCHDDGVSFSSGWGDDSSFGGGVTTADGTSRGSVRLGDQSYVFECRDGELTEFREQ